MREDVRNRMAVIAMTIDRAPDVHPGLRIGGFARFVIVAWLGAGCSACGLGGSGQALDTAAFYAPQAKSSGGVSTIAMKSEPLGTAREASAARAQESNAGATTRPV